MQFPKFSLAVTIGTAFGVTKNKIKQSSLTPHISRILFNPCRLGKERENLHILSNTSKFEILEKCKALFKIHLTCFNFLSRTSMPALLPGYPKRFLECGY